MSRPVYICLPPARTLHGSCGIYHTTVIAAGRCRDVFNRSTDGKARGGREVFAYDGADGPRELNEAERAMLPITSAVLGEDIGYTCVTAARTYSTSCTIPHATVAEAAACAAAYNATASPADRRVVAAVQPYRGIRCLTGAERALLPAVKS